MAGPVGTDGPEAGPDQNTHAGSPSEQAARCGDDRGSGMRRWGWGRRPGRTRGARGCGGRRAGPGERRAEAGRRNSPAPPACAPIGSYPVVTSRKGNGKTPTRHVVAGAGPAGKRRLGAREGPALLAIARAETTEAYLGSLTLYSWRKSGN